MSEMAAEIVDRAYGAAWEVLFVLGVLFLLLKAVTKVWKPARTLIDWTEKLNHLVATQDETNKVVKDELTPNGGGSMKDKVNRIHDVLCAGCPLFDDGAVCPRAVGGGQ